MQESYSKKAVRNVVYNFFNWISQNLLGLVFWIILGKLLLPQELGVFSAIFSFAMFLTMFALFGLPSTVMKIISEFVGKKEYEKIKALNSYVIKIIFLNAGIISFLILVLGDFISEIVNLTYSQLILSILIFITICFLYISGAILFGLGKIKEFVFGNVIYSLAKLVISILFIFIGLSYLGIAGAIAISALIAVAYRLRFIKFCKGFVEKEKIWNFAFSSFIGSIAGAIYNQGGILITKALSSAATTGIFTLAFTISLPLRTIPISLASAIFPLESEAWSKGKKQSVRNLISRVLKYSYMLCIPLLLIFLVFAKEIILFVSSIEYISGIEAIRLLVIGFIITGIGGIYSGSLYFIGKPNLSRNLSILIGVSLILFGIPLTMYYSIIGISLAYVLSGIIFFISSAFLTRKYIGICFEKRYLFISLFSATLALPILYIFRIYQPSIMGIAFASVLFSLAYFFLLLRLGFFDKKDIELLKIIGKRFPKNLKKKLKYIAMILEKYAK